MECCRRWTSVQASIDTLTSSANGKKKMARRLHKGDAGPQDDRLIDDFEVRILFQQTLCFSMPIRYELLTFLLSARFKPDAAKYGISPAFIGCKR